MPVAANKAVCATQLFVLSIANGMIGRSGVNAALPVEMVQNLEVVKSR